MKYIMVFYSLLHYIKAAGASQYKEAVNPAFPFRGNAFPAPAGLEKYVFTVCS